MPRSIVAAVIVLLGPIPAQGADLRFSTQASVEYDSNIRRSIDDPEDDAVWRVAQKLRLADQGSGYDYNLEYRLPYSVSTRTAVLRDVNHFGGVGINYQLGPRTSLSTRNNFAFINSASRGQFEDDAGVLQLDRRDELISRISGNLNLNHVFTSRVQGSVNFLYSYFDSTDDNRRQVSTVGGVSSLNYAVNSTSRVGIGGDVNRQAFDDLPGRPGSETITYRGFLSWVFRFDETLSFSLRGGPTLVSTEQNSVSTAVVPSPFVFSVLTGGTDVLGAAVDTNSDGISDTLQNFLNVPDGSLLITPFDQCGQLDGTPVLSCSAIRSVILNDGDPDNDTAIATVQGAAPVTLQALSSAGSSQTLTFFGSASLTKRWSPRVNTSIQYRRTQSDASGLGGSTILDAANATLRWRISQLWSSALRVDWTQRESAGDASQNFRVIQLEPTVGVDVPDLAFQTGARVVQTIPQEISTVRWAVAARVARRLTPRLRTTLRLSFNRQISRNNSAGISTDFDTFGAVLGFSYLFDPITVW